MRDVHFSLALMEVGGDIWFPVRFCSGKKSNYNVIIYNILMSTTVPISMLVLRGDTEFSTSTSYCRTVSSDHLLTLCSTGLHTVLPLHV